MTPKVGTEILDSKPVFVILHLSDRSSLCASSSLFTVAHDLIELDWFPWFPDVIEATSPQHRPGLLNSDKFCFIRRAAHFVDISCPLHFLCSSGFRRFSSSYDCFQWLSFSWFYVNHPSWPNSLHLIAFSLSQYCQIFLYIKAWALPISISLIIIISTFTQLIHQSNHRVTISVRRCPPNRFHSQHLGSLNSQKPPNDIPFALIIPRIRRLPLQFSSKACQNTRTEPTSEPHFLH